jgi:hypothetical protein
MPAVLVAFAPAGRPNEYFSVVKQMSEPLLTIEEIQDLESSLAAEYALDQVVIQDWDILPTVDEHPASGPYIYSLTFWANKGDAFGFAKGFVGTDTPILTNEQLKEVEADFSRAMGFIEIVVIGCHPLIG